MKKSQINDIKKYLETHKKGITSLQAIEMFGATRLAVTIHALRRKGLNIITEMKDVPTRYGTTKVAVYKLVD